MMKIKENDIQKYQDMYFDINKFQISKESAFAELLALVNFLNVIYKQNNLKK